MEAHDSNNDRITVHVFPTHLKGSNWKTLQADYKGKDRLIGFWKHLRPGYRAFEKKRKVPEITVDEAGSYQVKSN